MSIEPHPKVARISERAVARAERNIKLQELIDAWKHRAAMSHATGYEYLEEAYSQCARELQAVLDGN